MGEDNTITSKATRASSLPLQLTPIALGPLRKIKIHFFVCHPIELYLQTLKVTSNPLPALVSSTALGILQFFKKYRVWLKGISASTTQKGRCIGGS